MGDKTPPTVWTLQRLPWNPGGCGMGELWGYKYTPMPTYIYMLCVIMLLNVHIHSGTCSMCMYNACIQYSKNRNTSALTSIP